MCSSPKHLPVLLERQILVAEEDHLVVEPRLAQCRNLRVRQGSG
jgi:hypothetical protein